jgi:hypothetical protein
MLGRPTGLLHDRHLLLCGISAQALNTGKHFDSFSTVRHSRITRRTPSSYLGDCVRLKWGLLHMATAKRSKIGEIILPPPRLKSKRPV